MLTEREWEQMQERLTKAWHQGEFAAALTEVEDALAQGSEAIKGQALLYRGMIRDELGDLANARQDWMSAIGYCGEGSYGRYVAERSLGRVSEKRGTAEEALGWYRSALKTCAQGGRFSGGQALHAFLRVRESPASPEDQALVRFVVEKSWAVLELPGTPDLDDLARTAEALTKSAGEG